MCAALVIPGRLQLGLPARPGQCHKPRRLLEVFRLQPFGANSQFLLQNQVSASVQVCTRRSVFELPRPRLQKVASGRDQGRPQGCPVPLPGCFSQPSLLFCFRFCFVFFVSKTLSCENASSVCECQGGAVTDDSFLESNPGEAGGLDGRGVGQEVRS